MQERFPVSPVFRVEVRSGFVHTTRTMPSRGNSLGFVVDVMAFCTPTAFVEWKTCCRPRLPPLPRGGT